MKATTVSVVLLVIGLVVGAAVGYGVTAATTSSKSSSSATKTIYIGSIEPLSGGDAVYGQSFLQSEQLAVSQMNANLSAAGNNIQFKVVSADDAGVPATAGSDLVSMYATYGIHVLIGPLTSAEVAGVLQTADTDHIVVMPPASSAESLAYPRSTTNYLVRCGQPTDRFTSAALAAMATSVGAKHVVALVRDDSSEMGTYNLTQAILSPLGISMVEVVSEPSQTDYGAVVTTAASDAQSVLSAGGTTQNTIVMALQDETTEAQNIFTHAMSDSPLSSLRWFGVEAIDTSSLYASSTWGPWMAHVNFTMESPEAFASPQFTYFNSTFTAMFGSAPQPYSNYAYDNTWIAMLALLMTGGNNNGPDVLSVVYQAADHYFGATGTGVWLSNVNEQTFAYYNINEVVASGSTTTQITAGSYDGATNVLTWSG